MTFQLSQNSLNKLEGVHEDLVNVVKQAISISQIDFAVLEGLRTIERQRSLFAAGATQTLNSRHLTGHAVDLGAIVNGSICWHPMIYDKIANAMLETAAKLNIHIVWGGSWVSFKDLVHFELDKNFYKKGN